MAVFVHGCFWHAHEGCERCRIPQTRTEYWEAKLLANRQRDADNTAVLKAMGWKSTVVWECELKGANWFRKLVQVVGPPRV